ncbi:MAG: CSLREA domain-containing protein [Anaerolineales bacterium]|nr:CSLREA domain-containing protein [Anaerolineales bacterium]
MKHHPSRKVLLASLFLGILGLLAFPASVEASIFVVNTNDDLDDGVCDVSHCSLREAINATNMGAGPDKIHFNIPGSSQVTIQLNSPLPALQDDGTIIDGTSEPDYAGSPVIYLHKAIEIIEVGISIESNGNTVRGLGLVGFGVWLSNDPYAYHNWLGGAIVIHGADNLIVDNVIGSGAWLNSTGVRIQGPGNSVIDNVISGNSMGIYADHPNCLIQGNTIGPAQDGITAVRNHIGIRLMNGADGTLVGGDASGDGNLISANERAGIYMSSDNNTIYGNFIGVDSTGTSALPNGTGIESFGMDHQIGGGSPGQGNLISGNDHHGIWISGDGNHVIQGNKIGTDISGNYLIPNGGEGIECEGGPKLIGGILPGLGNLIMGNLGNGIYINDYGGGNVIAKNTIAMNEQSGVYVDNILENTITQNSIYANDDLGIRTAWGYNQGVEYPLLSSTLGVTIKGTACPNCLVEVFLADPDPTGYGEGKEYLNNGYASSNGSFSIPVNGLGFCDPVTATVTDAAGNTSEFSFNINMNCLYIGPLFLYPIWVFIIIVFAAIVWIVRRRRPAMPGWSVPFIAFGGGALFMVLVTALPFVEADFVPRSTCGDGVVNAGEQCDGDDLSFCRSDQVCKNCRCVTVVEAPICGDGDRDGEEQCDGDDLSFCLSGQVCENCRCITMVELCGNGSVDEGEQCDGDDLSMCRSDQVCLNCRCVTMEGICGNGIRDEGEQCDGDDLSFCLSGQVCQNCRCITVVETCGDGIVDEWEQCDGDDLSYCLSGQVCENCRCITHVEVEIERCIYQAAVNANCRRSDYAESDQVEILMQGEEAALVALNPEYTHGLFEFEGRKQCWIWLGLLDGPENPFGTCDVEIIDPPEAPREPACQQDLDEESCIAAGGEWIVGVAPSCKCPED